MHERLFFSSSKLMSEQIVDIFDFLWPTSVALWNLRWQVKGIVSERPDMTDAELLGRFVAGSNIHGANLRRSCIEVSWEAQQAQVAKFMLSEICALYEAWYSGFDDELGGFVKSGQLKAYETQDIVVGIASAVEEPAFANSYYKMLIKDKKYSFGKIKNLIICYRFFKELRNGQIHNGGTAGPKQVKAYNLYHPLSASDLGVKEKPAYPVIALGDKYLINLRGVVGFGDVVLRLICSIDAEIAKTTLALPAFMGKWACAISQKPTLPSSKELANFRIQQFLRKMRLKPSADCSALQGFLVSQNLVN
ncbi:hypothetical protein YA0002_17430 [Pseudomonas cichorii]|uniref:hypothetical protein n=1 Tax=Pseudomonas cichorii TaxID=36746 RepID=UPI0018E5F163|nr:hypothetical protein [Pseudomonas cichorii]MBI6854557.1 hypothetical protein [Pseudomonas cichorii]